MWNKHFSIHTVEIYQGGCKIFFDTDKAGFITQCDEHNIKASIYQSLVLRGGCHFEFKPPPFYSLKIP